MVKQMVKQTALIAFLALSLISVEAGAAVEPGQALSVMKLTDQHDRELTVDAKTKLLLFTRDQDGNKLVNKTLEAAPTTFLAERGAVYAADISAMPSIITKMFALPKMRGYPYSVALDRDSATTKELPSKAGQVTLIRLNELKVEKIDFYSDAEALKKALGN